MSYEITGRRRPTKPKKQARAQKRKREDVDVEKLTQSVNDLDVKGSFVNFTDLPLSEPTKAGLKAASYTALTDIQARAVPLALQGRDILGAARTGSGKTLAFLIPILENLYRSQCVGTDAGLGAMIISPTRELAIQIFDVLYKIGKHGHLFAAGLAIGGKSLQEEQHALARMNIVVCTPGRMLQHLSQTPIFSVDNLQMLVLDEADRILDMGFQRDVDAIVEYLPTDRQTLLFSATQTKKVSDLARLSLKDPEYVSVHEDSAHATPKTLQQNYTLTPLPAKLDTLWSFLQSAKKSKILVFLSSGKQVRFVYESFRRMQPGVPLLHLHGRQKQTARVDITSRFTSAQHSCLFATDVVARGLDFPAVDWVVQVDCPEDADTYIHRVGRTARYERDGRAVLFLDPSEEQGFLSRLESKKVPIEKINIRQKKQQTVKDQLMGMCFEDPQLKYLGQKAFASYVRGLHIQTDREVFDINSYDLEGFASSLGLPGAPRIKFLKGDAEAAKREKNAPRHGLSDSDASDDDAADPKAPKSKDKVRTKYDRMFERRNQDILADHYTRMIDDSGNVKSDTANGGADEEDELFSVRRIIPAEIAPAAADEDMDDDSDEPKSLTAPPKPSEDASGLIVDSKRRQKALKSRKKTARLLNLAPTHLVYDEAAGKMVPDHPFADEATALGDDKDAARRAYVAEESERLRERDVEDREVARQRRREKRLRRKLRDRALETDGDEGDGGDNGDSEDDGGGLAVMDAPFAELADLYDPVTETIVEPGIGVGIGSDGSSHRATGQEHTTGTGLAKRRGPRGSVVAQARVGAAHVSDGESDYREEGDDLADGRLINRKRKDGYEVGAKRSQSSKTTRGMRDQLQAHAAVPETVEDLEKLAADLLR